MFHKLRERFNSSPYLKKIAALFSATLIGQLLPFIFVPILSRLYTPEAYSVFGVFMVIAGVISQIGTLKLDQALLIPSSHDDAIRLAKTSLLSLLMVSALSFPLLLLYFTDHFFTLYVSLASVVLGAGLIFLQLANRMNYNKTIGLNKLVLGVSVSITQTIFSVFQGGLMLGKLTGDSLAMIPFLHRYAKSILTTKAKSPSLVWAKYRKFPLITLPHTLFNTIGNKLPTLIFAYLGLAQLSGEYENVFRLGMAPITIIAQALYLSFSSRFVELHQQNELVLPFIKKNLKGILLTVVLPMVPFLIISPWVIPKLLGEQWENSGIFFLLLSPLMISTVLASPFVYIMQYVQKQHIAFGLEVLINGFKSAGLVIGLQISNYWGLFLFSLFGAIGHVIYLLYSLNLVKKMDLNLPKSEK